MTFQFLYVKSSYPNKLSMTKLMFSGDGCVDKPLSTLWRNHISSEKADILMKVSQTPSMKQSDKRDNQICKDKIKAFDKLNLPM